MNTIKLEPKFSEIQKELFKNHKLNKTDKSSQITNGLLEEMSKMIAEGIQLAQEDK